MQMRLVFLVGGFIAGLGNQWVEYKFNFPLTSNITFISS
jgi:hypothetical protein